MAQAALPPSDLSEPLIRILTCYVSSPTAQSIVKLARQRANVTAVRLDRPRLAEMFAPIERNLRLFVVEPSKVAECCAAIQELIGGRSPLAEPSSVRSGAPASARSPEPSSVRSGAPASARSFIPPLLVQIRVEDDIARARSEARDLASVMAFSVVGRTRLVTAVSELARNIVLYAREGQIELLPVASPAGITVTASDRGPGIANLEQIMVGDYKSRLGMGLGLRGVKRLADRFEIHTAPGQGTTVSFFVKVL
jgi:serine/threonine-protein kinase RsbT